MRYPGFTRQAEKHGYLIVAPMGYNSRGWYGSRGTGGGRGSDPENLGELSEKDVMNVLALIRKEFNIDDNRIYLMGHSMGGGGTWHLGIKYPDIWAALGPIAPAAPRSTSGLAKITHIPVIVIQGDKDGLVRSARRWVAKNEKNSRWNTNTSRSWAAGMLMLLSSISQSCLPFLTPILRGPRKVLPWHKIPLRNPNR